MEGYQIGLLVVMIVLVLFSGFFSGSEMAFASVNKVRLMNMHQNGNKRAGKVLKLSENFDKVLSTILVGNNIVNISSTAIATLFFGSLIVDDPGLSTTISTIVMTVVVLIFGEITPKLIAKEKPEVFAILFYPLLWLFIVILYPITAVFSGLKWVIRKMLKVKKTSTVTEDELITIVETAEEEGELDEHESQLIRSAIEFEDLDVRDVMIPRVNVIAVEEKSDMETIYSKFVEHGFSRMPVYSETIDAVVGVIHEKDFFACMHDGGENIAGIIQNSVVVSSSMKISTVLRMLQKEKVHMAIVIDEFGGTEGIVTLEDILEELVGEIYDEHDEVEELFMKVDENVFIVSGDENVEDMYEKLELTLPEDIESTTVNGFVTEKMDKIPVNGEKLELVDMDIEILQASERHIEEVKITRLTEEQIEERKKQNEEEN